MLTVILENLKNFFRQSLGWSQIGLYGPKSPFGTFSDGFRSDSACIQAGIARMMQMLTVMGGNGIILR